MAAEKNFEDRVKAYLKECGCWFVKYWGGGAYTRAGVPDLLVCCRGRFIGIELKAPNGKPEELQLQKLRKIDESGGVAVLLFPADFEIFKLLIEKLNNYERISPDNLPEYEYFRKVRQKWEQKLSVSIHLNYGC